MNAAYLAVVWVAVVIMWGGLFWTIKWPRTVLAERRFNDVVVLLIAVGTYLAWAGHQDGWTRGFITAALVIWTYGAYKIHKQVNNLGKFTASTTRYSTKVGKTKATTSLSK